MDLYDKYGIGRPNAVVCSNLDEVRGAAEKFGDAVIKAQVLAGGRGKGHFDNGFVGGVHLTGTVQEALDVAGKMLGHHLITKQTGDRGKPCNKVLVTERVYLRKEAYFAILLDRESGGPVMIASPKGGMDIETVAKESPDAIFRENIDPDIGLKPEQTARLASKLGFQKSHFQQADETLQKLYELFKSCDATQVEVNPLGETVDGRVLCVDAKLNFDDNAVFRQKEIFELRDPTQEDSREVEAEKYGLNYIGLDGNIGCMVNGAGLAMATMDCIKLYGGSPANFLDLGGGASKDVVAAAFALLNRDPQVEAILVNVFGGIARCDVIALGLIAAATKLGLKKPVVIRLAGTNVKEAVHLIEESGLRMLTAHDLGEAAQKVVRVVDIVRMAREAHLDIAFELPI